MNQTNCLGIIALYPNSGFVKGYPNSVINLLRKIDSLAAWERASSSASVVEVITVGYLFARQPTNPPNSLSMKPCELFLSSVLSANEASEATKKSSDPPKRRPRSFVR